MEYEIYTDITTEEQDYVQRKLVEFSDQFTEPRNYTEFGLVLRGNNGSVGGGITATTVWDWLQIGILWISEDLRGKGYGSRLLAKAEEVGRRRGCRHAKLDTFEFEAREFYEYHGYVVRSKTEDFPQGHVQYHMEKDL